MTDKTVANGEKLQNAIAKFDTGDHHGAIQQLSQMYRSDPRNAEIAHTLGLMLARTGQTDDAVTLLRRASAASFLNPEYYADLAMVYLNSDDQERARNCIVTSLALDPVNSELKKSMIAMSVREGRSGNEISKTEVYPATQLENFESDGQAIIARLAEGNYDRVISDGQRILLRRPGDVRAHYCIGVALESYNHVAQVIDHLEAVASSMPAFAAANKGLGDYLHQAWRLKSIRNSFAEGVLNQPRQDDGNSYLVRAGKSYRAALYHQPDDAETRLYYGNLLNDMGDAPGAREQYNLAVQLEPGRVSAQFNLAQSMLKAGETDLAMNFVDEVIASEPEFREALGLKAALLSLKGDRIGAGMTSLPVIDMAPKFSTEVYF